MYRASRYKRIVNAVKISPSETRILDILYRAEGPMTCEDVTAALGDEAEWSEGTVRTFLTRLTGKRALTRRKEGRRFFYIPVVAKDVHARQESRRLLERLFDGRLAPFVNQFTEGEKLSDDDIAELRALVERLDRDR